MMILIQNEFGKMKRLKSMIMILLLSFLPYVINTLGLLIMKGDRDAGQYYFFVFNQNAVLFPALIFIYTGYAFYIEYKNRTILQWLSYPYSNFQLILSKMIAAFLLLLTISLLNQMALFATLWAAYSESLTLSEAAGWFAGSLSFTCLSMLSIPVAAVIALLTRNIVGVILAGVASIFVTTILLGLNISVAYPFSYAYRLSIQFYDASFGYPSAEWYVWGSAILLVYSGLSSLLLYKSAKNPQFI